MSCENRGEITGGAQQATELCRVVDTFCALLPTKDNGQATKPAAKFIELCGGAERARELLELYVKRIVLMLRIWELAHGKPPPVASWGENALALVAKLGDRVRVLGHHMHPARAIMLYQKNWNGIEHPKHVLGPDACLAAIAEHLGLTVTRASGTVLRYWDRLWKNDTAAGEANSDYNWDLSKERYYALTQAHEDEDGTGHWSDVYPERCGPSKEWGVIYEYSGWRARIETSCGKLHLGVYADEDYAGRVVDAARVKLDLEPKNDLALWLEIVAWVKADKKGAMPFEPARALPGAVHVATAATSALADATSPVEEKIAKAVRDNPSDETVGPFLFRSRLLRASQLSGRVEAFAAAGICTVEDLAHLNVGCAALITICCKNTTEARKKLLEWKCAAAAQFGVVEIGTLPRKKAKPRKKSLAARLDGKTLEQQGVHKAVADWEAHAANYNPAYAQGYAKALVAIAQQRHADEPMPAAGGEEP